MTIVTKDHSKATVLLVIGIAVTVLAGCKGRDDFDIRETDTAYAYRSTSVHADVLKKCVLITTVAESCKIAELPPIGDGVSTPTVDQVMDRVLVTHDWMGLRFEQVLRDSPESLLTLFSSTTAILIGSKVRPSFYTRLNGAIQLDPVYLWMSREEKGTISRQQDFRSDFGKDLQFWFRGDLVNPDGSRAARFYSLSDDSERPLNDVKIPLQRLLFHELVHATDFMPRNKIASLDPNMSIYESIDSIRDDWLSNSLKATYPLNSDTLREFAKVRFRGTEASSAQKLTDSTEMGALMSVDGAIHFYSYSSQYEDLAQLVENVMMGHHFDLASNIGFMQKPANEARFTCNDLIVGWGQRNRLADPLVSVRARAAAELTVNLTPELTEFMDSGFGAVEQMTRSVSWCRNQKLDTTIASGSQSRSAEPIDAPMSDTQFTEMMQSESVVHHQGIYHD